KVEFPSDCYLIKAGHPEYVEGKFFDFKQSSDPKLTVKILPSNTEVVITLGKDSVISSKRLMVGDGYADISVKRVDGTTVSIKEVQVKLVLFAPEQPAPPTPPKSPKSSDEPKGR